MKIYFYFFLVANQLKHLIIYVYMLNVLLNDCVINIMYIYNYSFKFFIIIISIIDSNINVTSKFCVPFS